MSEDDSDGNRFGYVTEMPNYDQTSMSPGVDRDNEGGLVENTEKRMNRRKWAARGLGGATALATTAGVCKKAVDSYDVDMSEYMDAVTGEVAGYMADPQNVERAAEASQFVSEIVTNLG